jgi:hypothetical protein
MLSLCFKPKDFAFFYHRGIAIGAVYVGGAGGPKVSLLFAGEKDDFEVLRANVVEKRFGTEELARLVAQFLPSVSENVLAR